MTGVSLARIVKNPAVVLVAILIVATGWLAFRDWREGKSADAPTRRQQIEAPASDEGKRADAPTGRQQIEAPASDGEAKPVAEAAATTSPGGSPATARPPAIPGGGSPVIARMTTDSEVILGGAAPGDRFAPRENEGESWLSAENLLINGLVIALLTIGLVLVLKLFKRWVPGSQHFFGSPAIRIHGRNAIGARQAIYLIQVGDHLLVVGATQDRMQTLAQIDDPDEIARVLAASESAAPDSMTRSFKDLLTGSRANLKPNERAVEDLAPVFSDVVLTEKARDDS